MYDAAVAAAAPGPLTTAALLALPASTSRRARLFALGKGAHAMCSAAVDGLSRSSHTIAGGVIVAPELAPAPHPAVIALAGDHPMPGPRSFAAARRLGDESAAMREGDLAVVLLSGGTSSLIAAPLPGLREDDLVDLFALLHRSGLDIHAMNAVRKRFSRWGAGRLAVALAPAHVEVLVVSDVPGDDVADVASGPCSADSWSARDVLDLLHRTALLGDVPAALREHLDAVLRGELPETPKATHPTFAHVATRLVGSNRLAVDAAAACARALSLSADVAAEPIAGDAARCGEALADALMARAERDLTGCVVWGGETTVRLATGARGAPTTMAATGGRCQELALAAARRLAQGGDAARRVALLAAGTDGRDGPTDAAGAFADATVWSAMARRGHDPEHALARHESYAALDAAGALFRRGLTGTNVMDVVIGVVESRPLHGR
jgi:hydroxypyruvate reductase